MNLVNIIFVKIKRINYWKHYYRNVENKQQQRHNMVKIYLHWYLLPRKIGRYTNYCFFYCQFWMLHWWRLKLLSGKFTIVSKLIFIIIGNLNCKSTWPKCKFVRIFLFFLSKIGFAEGFLSSEWKLRKIKVYKKMWWYKIQLSMASTSFHRKP